MDRPSRWRWELLTNRLPRRRGVGQVAPRGPGGGQGGRQASSGFEQLGDSPFFVRGNIENAGDPVKRGVPTIISPAPVVVSASTSGRLELAESLIAADNRLVSRVIVNRVWHWLFGRGLVASVDNFGTTGGTPSHPELLDTLAVRFQRDGWSIKRLVREIATSHTYRLAATYDERTSMPIQKTNGFGDIRHVVWKLRNCATRYC